MRDHYDFSASKPNAYARRAKQQITIHLDSDTLSWFKAVAHEQGIPYQSLINLYLRDCAEWDGSWSAVGVEPRGPADAAPLTFPEFEDDHLHQLAILKAVEIIGKAASRVSE